MQIADCTIDSAYIRQLQDMQVPEAEIQKYIQAQNELDSFDVWPENWAATQLFRLSLTQRIYSGLNSVVTGFNYAGVEVVMRANGYDWSEFKKFQQMETIALNFWSQ